MIHLTNGAHVFKAALTAMNGGTGGYVLAAWDGAFVVWNVWLPDFSTIDVYTASCGDYFPTYEAAAAHFRYLQTGDHR